MLLNSFWMRMNLQLWMYCSSQLFTQSKARRSQPIWARSSRCRSGGWRPSPLCPGWLQVCSVCAQKIVEYVSKNYDIESEILNANAELKETKNGISGVLFAAMLVCGGGYGGYKVANDHRYSVEKEYAFISTCVGEYGHYNTKSYCVEKLKKCQEDGKKYYQCH